MPLQAQNKHLLQSLILPGWGEAALNQNRNARIFYTTESTFWVAALVSAVVSNYHTQTSKAFAAEYAGVEIAGKDDRFWIDIGNYNSRDAYNAEHLRWRDYESLYGTDSNWEWKSAANREKFENMRIKGDRWHLALQFMGAGLVVNRIISAIDVLYLSRKTDIKLTVTPSFYSGSMGYSLIFTF